MLFQFGYFYVTFVGFRFYQILAQVVVEICYECRILFPPLGCCYLFDGVVVPQSVSKWEMDQALPQIDKVLQLAEIFGVSTDELLYDKNSDYKGKKKYQDVRKRLEIAKNQQDCYNLKKCEHTRRKS